MLFHSGSRLSEQEDEAPLARFDPSLWSCLRHPRRQIQAFEALQAGGSHIPYPTWGCLTGIALGGSALYGASLSLLFARWRPSKGALWLALSAGLSWCIFGPLLVLVTRRNLLTCAHACLVTMAYGEGVLITGAGVNVLLARASRQGKVQPLKLNLSLIGLSNIVMAAMLALQLRVTGVPAWKTLLSWMLCQNFCGVLLFRLFQGLLGGKH